MKLLRDRKVATRMPVLIAAGALLLASCQSGPTARIKDSDEGNLVGINSAGSAVYEQQVEAVVQKMLAGEIASNRNLQQARICVLRVENRSAEDLGDWSEQLYSLISGSIDSSDRFGILSTRALDRALQEGDMIQDDLLLPKYQRKFVEILEAAGNPIQYLVFPSLTSGSTSGGSGVSQRDYLMELELVALENGESRKYSAKISKEYER